MGMSERDCIGDFFHQAGGFNRLQWSLANQMRQRVAFYEGHREKMATVLLANLIDGNDARMFQFCGSFRLRLKTLDFAGSCRLAGQDHLQRNSPLESLLPCLVNNAHAAASDFLNQLVFPEVTLTWGNRLLSTYNPRCLRSDFRDGLCKFRRLFIGTSFQFRPGCFLLRRHIPMQGQCRSFASFVFGGVIWFSH